MRALLPTRLLPLLLLPDAALSQDGSTVGSAVVPEPATVLILLLGLAGLFFGRKAFRSAFRTLAANRDTRR